MFQKEIASVGIVHASCSFVIVAERRSGALSYEQPSNTIRTVVLNASFPLFPPKTH
jgi:hypothetical protein